MVLLDNTIVIYAILCYTSNLSRKCIVPDAQSRNLENREAIQGFAYDLALGFDVSDQKSNLELVFDNPGIFDLVLKDVKADLGESPNEDIQKKLRQLNILSTKVHGRHSKDVGSSNTGDANKKARRRISGDRGIITAQER